MNQQTFDELKQTLETEGAENAIQKLCDRLSENKEYHRLFYGMLMKKRFELGVDPIPTSPSQELPESTHAAYEDAIRNACRTVGDLFLAQGDIPNAWVYYRMIDERESVRKALENANPSDEDDVQPIVEIAFHEMVHPEKGFDLILDRYGICSAITTMSGFQFPLDKKDVKAHCIRQLIRTLYEELKDRLIADVSQREGEVDKDATIRQLITGRDWLFEEDYYHVDVSHLHSVVQMATELDACAEMEQAIEMCEYGHRLPEKFQFNSEPPFDEPFRDYGIFLSVLAGKDVETGLLHFRKKADEADPYEVGSFPAEVFVNLLLRLGRTEEAIAVSRKHLTDPSIPQLSCPNLVELCQKAKDYETLAEVAKEQGDSVHYMAGLLGASQNGKK